MTTPFFSVVIPTKNRSFLIGLAIQSILRQSFSDFEIVIADNDDNNSGPTRPVSESFNDPRIRYYRTGSLSMPDNWEFAVSKSQGEYIAILEDKQVLRKHALERIFKEVEKTRHPVVGWLYDRYYDTQQPPKIIKTEGTGDCGLISSQQIIETFVEHGRFGDCDRLLPRGLNSCVHNSLVDRIRSGPAGRLCMYMTPDYTMGFQLLAYCDAILHIDEPLVVVGGYKYSTGRTSKESKTSAFKYYQEFDWDESICYNKVPIKAFTISGALYNDYENIRMLVGGNLTSYPLNMYQYFIQCFNDIQISKNQNVQMLAEEIEWLRAVSEQDLSIQSVLYQKFLTDYEKIITDQKALIAKLSSQLSEVAISRDTWKANYRKLERKMTVLDRFLLSRWSRKFFDLLRINNPFELSEDSLNPVQSKEENPGLDQHDIPIFSNALEYVEWEESHQPI